MGLIITIGGTPGSGKSTTGRMIASRLGIPFFSMGDIRRKYAAEKGMTILEAMKAAETDPETDRLVDEFQAKLPEQHPSFVIDSRLGFHFLPQGVKIYLRNDTRMAAERIMREKRSSEPWRSVEEGIAELESRQASDVKRYKELYGIDHTDITQYDFVLDTSGKNQLEVLDAVIGYLTRNKLI